MTVIPIETPYGPIPVPLAIPAHPPTDLHIPRVGDDYTWGDVNDFAKNAVDDVWHGITGLFGSAKDAVQTVEHAVLATTTQVIATFAELAIDYTITLYTHAEFDIADAKLWALDIISGIESQIGWIGDEIAGIDGELTGILDGLVGIIDYVVLQAVPGILGEAGRWAIDNIYNPLDTDIRTLEDRVDRTITGAVADVEAYARDLVDSEALRRAAAIGAVAVTVAGILDWVAECGEPTCEFVGPNTKLGKLLKGLEALLGVLAGAELATLTEADLEHLAGILADVGGTGAQHVLSGFVEGGETIGTAGRDLLGDITDAGAAVLRELGVPVP